MPFIRFIYLIALLTTMAPLDAALVFGPHRLSAFAEGGRVSRKRQGGTHQKGALLGYGCEYERLKNSGIYLLGRAVGDEGTLRGRTGSGFKIKSRYDSQEYFGRGGWSFCFGERDSFVVAPFAGGGYFRSENRFVDPSPIPVNMQVHFLYALGGLTFEWRKQEDLYYTFSFQGKKPFDPECVIKDDPELFEIHQLFKSKMQWDVETGFRKMWGACFGCKGALEGQLFYRHSRYGKKENFPFDFADTRQKFWGIRIGFSALF
ncbi:hypothetical protein [Estrella lausannensis]|uniref:Putative secreted protein n=1 Tax=Estrella lausannensis TaxID=483423 RepID=A0A0H5E343_9BACT|nr:hypothetical protein [Estrella lausannensis]CRX37610.1 putative secreted protein [Estrella lausannensis]